MIPLPLPFEKIAESLLPKIAGAAFGKLTRKPWNAAWAGVYKKWQQSFQSPEVGEEKLNAVFEEFFSRKDVIDQLEKIGRDQYREVDFTVMTEQLQESFAWAGCAAPTGDLHKEIDSWLRDLKKMLEENPEYRREHGIAVQAAIRESGQPEAPAGPDSLARKKYLDSVIRQHRYIRFSGMADVSGPPEVEIARVFVMPRVVRREEGKPGREKEPKAIAADRLITGTQITGTQAARRLVILGGPGSGKTTLLEALSLGFARSADFSWSKRFPALLPVFYRIRDLDRDLAETGGTIWDCLAHHHSQRMGETLPKEFFHRQMEGGGVAVLLDGLDEAGSVARRNQIVDLVGEFAETLSPESRLIVTSRPHDYRHRFEAASYRQYDLQEFDDDEIVLFIQGWQEIHEPDRKAASEKGEILWKALEARKDILPLARNALLLTMIVRVHFGLGALPDSRLGLYEKCAETLLKHWADAKDLGPGPIDYTQKHKLLQRLAWEMQGEAEEWSGEMSLQISRADLARRFERALKEEGEANALRLVDSVIDRLHARDAVLVQYGSDGQGQDQFGFVHRSFQEYFAACWMAQELDSSEFDRQLAQDRPGWNETLYLAVAKLPDRRRRRTLLESLKVGRADFAVDCLRAAPKEQTWLTMLVRFLSRYTWAGLGYERIPVTECAEACAERAEVWDVLEAMFAGDNREGKSLAAALELVEEFARRGEDRARRLLEAFYSEAVGLAEDMVLVAEGPFPFGDDARIEGVPAFFMDRYPVTNEEFERMIPGHRKMRRSYSDQDRQPVVTVNWFEARLYCQWRGRGCRLPTEFEWEKAAGWDPVSQMKRRYPWGDEFEPRRCNTRESGIGKTTPVYSYPAGRSAYGCEDMAGNVWEWTASEWSEGSEMCVARGGSWMSTPGIAACAYRYNADPRNRDFGAGFRCART